MTAKAQATQRMRRRPGQPPSPLPTPTLSREGRGSRMGRSAPGSPRCVPRRRGFQAQQRPIAPCGSVLGVTRVEQLVLDIAACRHRIDLRRPAHLQIVLELSANVVFGAEQDQVFVVGSHQTLDLAGGLHQGLLVNREVAQLVVPYRRHRAIVAYQLACDVNVGAVKRDRELDVWPRARAAVAGRSKHGQRRTVVDARLDLGESKADPGQADPGDRFDLARAQRERNGRLREARADPDVGRWQLPIAQIRRRLRQQGERRQPQQHREQHTHGGDSS